jgi:hypothetical protein
MTMELKFPQAKPLSSKEENQSKFLSNINPMLLDSINTSVTTKLLLKIHNIKHSVSVSKSNSLKMVSLLSKTVP